MSNTANQLSFQLSFDYSKARALCAETGLQFDEGMAIYADPFLKENGLTQDQVDFLTFLWCRIVSHTWDRKSHKLMVRLCMALYWLGFGKSIKSII